MRNRTAMSAAHQAILQAAIIAAQTRDRQRAERHAETNRKARVYDASLVGLPRNQRYVIVSHDCSEHNDAVDDANRERMRRWLMAERSPWFLARKAGFDTPRSARRCRITQTKPLNKAALRVELSQFISPKQRRAIDWARGKDERAKRHQKMMAEHASKREAS